MKIAYKHLINLLADSPSIEDISEKLFQLGHEHEIENKIFDMEFTPNRGDCLSLLGLARDLNVFYNINLNLEKFEDEIPSYNLNFSNKAPEKCHDISFLKIDIKQKVSKYKNYLEDYFADLKLNKNNFFTDVSNYVAYEMGQPTHCYDFNSIEEPIILKDAQDEDSFNPLIGGESLDLQSNDLVFFDKNGIINLAGIMGSKQTSCSSNTLSVLVECAYFKPESIIGKAVKYNLFSDASHKFERGVDPLCHDEVLRRFIQIVGDHVEISDIGIYSNCCKKHINKNLDINLEKINKILGTNIDNIKYTESLEKLNFNFDKKITIPSYRSDVTHQNDLAEEIARIIGYNNIPSDEIAINNNLQKVSESIEDKIKSFLIDNGFYEVVNAPFVSKKNENSVFIDNPLDSNRKFLRTNLTDSLLENLLSNERRQKDSIKLFEISDIYYFDKEIQKKRKLSIIASGRAGKNYNDFSKKIDINYVNSILSQTLGPQKFKLISRENLNSKKKSNIVSLEIDINKIPKSIFAYKAISTRPKQFVKYEPISEFPSTSRDISFSVNDSSKISELEEIVMNFKNNLIKDRFIFDYFKNDNKNEIKIGFRFLLQHSNKTLRDDEVETMISDIVKKTTVIKGVSIPGFK